jgi:hypothetical protein
LKKVYLGSEEAKRMSESKDGNQIRAFFPTAYRSYIENEFTMMLTLMDRFKKDYLISEISIEDENIFFWDEFVRIVTMVPYKVFYWGPPITSSTHYVVRYNRASMIEVTKNPELSIYWRVRYKLMVNNGRWHFDEPFLDYAEHEFPINNLPHGWFKHVHLVDSELVLKEQIGWARTGQARVKHYFVTNDINGASSLCKTYSISVHHALHSSKFIEDSSDYCKKCLTLRNRSK